MTFVFFHAHPDDEAVATAGTMTALAEAGHRVAVVFATGGEQGIRPSGTDDAALARLRAEEAERAAALLGVARVHFLGYGDSGDTPGEHSPESFVASDPAEAADRLVEVVRAEHGHTLISYDQSGVTWHPDHLRVHLVGRLAHTRLPGIRLYEGVFGTTQRDEFGKAAVALFAARSGATPAPDQPASRPRLSAVPDEYLSLTVDVRRWLPQKRAALAAHASQIDTDSFFLALDDAQFASVFGTESYLDPHAVSGEPDPLLAAMKDLGVLL